jgi:hypothetical protein
MFPSIQRAAVYLALVCAAYLATSVHNPSTRVQASVRDYQSAPAGQADEQQARVTCGGCHSFPPPDILPRQAWRNEFVQMMLIRENRPLTAGRPMTEYQAVALPSDMEQALAFFIRRAPEHLPAPARWPAAAESPLRLVRQTLTLPDMPQIPAVSNIQLVDFDGDKRLDVIGTDMRQGFVFTGRPERAGSALSIVANIPHPAHVTSGDVDGDGIQDLLVGDLGEFLPADHAKGAVFWLRGRGNGRFGTLSLEGWPRVADVEIGDFNGDGRNDLVVAAFGWRKTGHISILENRTTNAEQPMLTVHTIDPRPGGIHVIPTDLNHDGKMDFVTLLAQEHETVLAYVNKGTDDFAFERKVIYAAPHPNWGSSGIQLVDLDQDGDRDVILTHGDTFDDQIVKPYHGIQWLENKGDYPFVEHTLAQMPGVHRAAAADIDGDGDLDIIACALLAGGSDVDETTLPALVWLEQTKRGIFTRHTIEMGTPRHATLDAGDIDGDGDIDIVVGNMSIDKPSSAWIDVWVNQLKKP